MERFHFSKHSTMRSGKTRPNNPGDSPDDDLGNTSDDSFKNEYASIPLGGNSGIEVGGSDIEIDTDSIASSHNFTVHDSLYAEGKQHQLGSHKQEGGEDFYSGINQVKSFDSHSSAHSSRHNFLQHSLLRISRKTDKHNKHFIFENNPLELHFPRSHPMANADSIATEDLQSEPSNVSVSSAENNQKDEGNDKSKNKRDKARRKHHYHRYFQLFSSSKKSQARCKSDSEDSEELSAIPTAESGADESMDLENGSTVSIDSSGLLMTELNSLNSSETTKLQPCSSKSESQSKTGGPDNVSSESTVVRKSSMKSLKRNLSMSDRNTPEPNPAVEASSMTRNNSTMNSSSGLHKSSSTSRFRNFTRRAARFAEDIAFGSTVYSTVSKKNSRNLNLPARSKLSPYEKKQLQVAEFRKNLQSAELRIYFETLRFFLKYMDESNSDDPINYALTRKNLWLLWYQKLLERVNADIVLYEQLMTERDTLIKDALSGKEIPGLEKQKSGFKGAIQVIPIVPSERKKETFPSPELVAQDMFQDRRAVLFLLWHLKQYCKMLKQEDLFKEMISSKPDDPDAPAEDLSTKEVCLVSTNRMNAFKKRILTKEDLKTLEKSTSETLEFVDGWNVRHAFPGAHINVITVASKFLTLTDIKGKGTLDAKRLAENPQFGQHVLTKYYYENNLSAREREFLEDYSSFSTPSVAEIPLKDSSQELVLSEDATSLVSNVESLKHTIKEFERILKPKGKIYLQVWDIDPDTQKKKNKNGDAILSAGEFVKHSLWQKLTAYAFKNKTAVTNLSKVIVPMLRAVGFVNIKTAFISYPMLTSLNISPESARSTKKSHASLSIGDLSSIRNDDFDSILGSSSTSATETGSTAATAAAEAAALPPDLGKRDSKARGTSTSTAGQSTRSTSLRNGRDSRLDSFFEMMTSFTEFMKAQKALNLPQLRNELSECVEIEDLKKEINEKGDPDGLKVQELNSRIVSMKPIDEERLNLVKLLLDYKLNGFNGSLVASEILQRGSYSSPKYLSGRKDPIEGDVMYEGVSYMLAVTAVKKE